MENKKTPKNILFFSHLNKEKCEVLKIWISLQSWRIPFISRFFDAPKYFLIEDCFKNYSDYLEQNKVSTLPMKRIIVFGYKDLTYPVIKHPKAECYIGSKWFDLKTDECISVFFVSNGAKLLRSITWAENFTNWVSFDGTFDFLTGLKISENVGNKIYHEAFISTTNKYGKKSDAVMTNYKLMLNKSVLVNDSSNS